MQTNDPEHAKVNLVCKARTLVAFNANPGMANFGRITRDAGPQTKTLVLTRGDGGPINPELVPGKSPSISTELREIEPGEKYELDVTASPPWPNDRLHDRLTVKTGLPEAPDEYIRIFATVDPRLQSVPKYFTLPSDVTNGTELRVQLRWAGGEPGNVLKATVGDPDLSVRVEEEDGQQFVVLSVPAGYKRPPTRTSHVTVKTDDEVAPILQVRIAPARRPRASTRSDASPKPAVRVPTTAPRVPYDLSHKSAATQPSE